MTLIRSFLTVLALSAVGLIAGCGSGSPASGKVTFAGEPVPVGTIQFVPDGAGSSESALVEGKIEQGAYTTSSGVTPGSYEVIIDGYDGVPPPGVLAPNGKSLFSTHRVKATVTGSESSLDFDVPAPAAKAK